MILRKQITWRHWVEHLVLAALVLHFAVRTMPRAWGSLITDFPNYYLAAKLAHEHFDTARMYEWQWLEREKDHRSIPIRVIGLVPVTPFSTLFVWPLTSLKPLVAKCVWILLSLALLIPLGWLLRRMTRLGYERIALIFALSIPLRQNIEIGQFYIVLLLLIVAGCWCYIQNRHALSGALIAVAASAKIFPLLLFVFFLQRRNWRALAAGVVTGAATVALSIGVFGWSVHRTYLKEILPAALHGEAMPPYLSTSSFSGLLHVLFLSEPQWNPHPWHSSVAAFSILLPILSMLVLAPAILLISRDNPSPQRTLLEWSALLTASLAISTIPASYNFVLMVFPACVIGAALLEQKRYGWLAALLMAYAGIGFSAARLPLMLAVLVGIYAMLWPDRADGSQRRDWTRYAWAVVMIVAVAAQIHSTWIRESGVRREYAYRLPAEPQGYLNAYPRSENGNLRYISFTLDGYRLVMVNAAGSTADPAAGSPIDDLSFTVRKGQVLAERATAGKSSVVSLSTPSQPVVENAQEPSFSVDGESLGFLREDHGRRQLMTVALAGPLARLARPLAPPALNVYEATYRSDGEYAFSAAEGSRPPQIYLTDGAHNNVPVGLGTSRYPALSPDGAWLAYSRLEGVVWNLWIRDQHSGTTRRIGDVPCNEIQASWLPDSKTLLYSTDCGRNLWFTAIARRKVIP